MPEGYVAEWKGERHLKLYLFRDADDSMDPARHINGWTLAIDQLDETGEWWPVANYFDEKREKLLEFPALHAPKDIVWRDNRTGEIVDIYKLGI